MQSSAPSIRFAGPLVFVLLCASMMPPSSIAGPPAGLEWQTADGSASALHLGTSAELEVSGMIARVTLVQTYRNDTAEWMEGVYSFPLPAAAAVDTLQLSYGDTLIVGEIREKEEAARSYAAAREDGRRSVLVERQRPNLFRSRLANVAPGETVRIEIGWQQTVDYDDGEYRLRLPLTITPPYAPADGNADSRRARAQNADPPRLIFGAATAGSHRFSLSGRVDAGIELAYLASRYHPLAVTADGKVYRFAMDDVPMDRDVELHWRARDSEQAAASLFRGAGPEGANTLFVLFHPPHTKTSPAAAGAPRELIFVLDTSGSMHGESLDQAKHALAYAMSRLRPVDRFNLIEFNSDSRRLFPIPLTADAANLEEASRLLAGLEAEGGTEMAPALVAALQDPPPNGVLRQIVFVTDGAVSNETRLLSLVRERIGEARLFTVAIGSAPNVWFMREAAKAGRGSYEAVGSGADVAERMARLFRKLERSVLTDIEIRWPAGTTVSAYPERIPDLYHGEPLLVAARFERWPPPGSVITVRGSDGEGYWLRQLSLDDPGTYTGVAKLWARARIEALENSRRYGADAAMIREAIVGTALSHGLVSAWTSLVAVDRSPARPDWARQKQTDVPNMHPRGQTLFDLPATATSAPLRRLTGLLCLLATLAVLILLRVRDTWRCRAG